MPQTNSQTQTETEEVKVSYSDIPVGAQKVIFSFLDNKNLLNAASINKTSAALVKEEKENRQDLQGIFADGVYFILGKSVETTTRDLFSIYYLKARNVPQLEIINATPARGSKVDVYRTLEEAKHKQNASHADSGDMTSPNTMRVIFAVKLKDNEAIYTKFQQKEVSYSRGIFDIPANRQTAMVEYATLNIDSFEVISAHFGGREVNMQASQSSALGFFNRAAQRVSDAVSSLNPSSFNLSRMS
ncbi:hypothetical protein BN59_01137 [Legionella massiliensis]|uniref:F-box domain-containing protein n=1 Tax=Legionella massiliensis TaxID=1034943 RepID=A0A078KV02_9GAMM|nr:hypothetical protein [Legionella massiliensis]CDZ76861.1 hypothetical protein BN59_01137 [Legionella massiliensis]CEE12599.1 hypothetical protein BN1094_01137 [Legionella massiliensis]